MSYLVDTDDPNINLNIPMSYDSSGPEITDFRCDECGKYFAAARSLVLHKKIHTGIKPYICPHEGCGKGFYVRAQLVRHSYTHSTVRTEKCPYKNCTSPIKLFKTKADVRQHIKNWHTLEKSEQRELRLIKKLEKWNKLSDSNKQLREQNRRLEEEAKKLREEIEHLKNSHNLNLSTKTAGLVDHPDETKPRRPVPAYTQFLQEQYQKMRDMGNKLSFAECSKQISKMWHDLSEEEKKPYIDRFRREMDDYNHNRFNPSDQTPSKFLHSNSSDILICRKCGSNDIFRSFSSNPLFNSSFAGQAIPEALPSLQMIPDPI